MKKLAVWGAVLMFVALCSVTACKKKAEPAMEPQLEPLTEDTEPEIQAETRTMQLQLSADDYDLTTDTVKAPAHAKYLSDPMVFSSLPASGVTAEKTAVVGTDTCMLYPIETISSAKEIANLPQGEIIPFGTIIAITGEAQKNANAGEYENGLFQIGDNWNWFYPTEYNGKKGLVFGAHLYGVQDTPEQNEYSALLYKTNGRFDSFYPQCGYEPLGDELKKTIEAHRIAFEEVSPDEYWLSLDRPDDMISLYLNHLPSASHPTKYNRNVPVFVTTDLIAHAQHLMFDRFLQNIEETYFLPQLNKLCGVFIQKLEQAHAATIDNAESVTAESQTAVVGGANTLILPEETIEKALLYFQTAQALLELAPEKQTAQPYSIEETVYVEKNRDEILAKYPQSVRDEIALMDACEGFASSSVFTFADGTVMQEDYSQYKARGHYTKNGCLSAYFKTMMWFGRINFPLADVSSIALDANAPLTPAQHLSFKMAPVALYITDLIAQDENLYTQWRSLFEPVTALIGKSDDLSFFEILPLWQKRNVSDVKEWISKPENIISFIQEAQKTLEPPAISGSSVFFAASEKGTDGVPKQPMGWRLFGQRFTYDSWVHQKVSPPRLSARDMVRGLDIMKSFGSKTADALLQKTDYPTTEGLQNALTTMESYFKAQTSSFWNMTYYNQVLFETGAQALFEPGIGLYFTETPAWGIKSMLSSHGTWAELRHDTLLYVKQVYAERGGDGDFEPTYKTKPIPSAVHYLEPNVPFYQGAAAAVDSLINVLNSYNMMSDTTVNEGMKVLTRFKELLARAEKIAQQELNDEAVSDADIKWIPRIPSELVQSALIFENPWSYVENDDLLKMAVVADVYTNAELGLVLETGVGIPYRMYTALNDAQGGKRIAVGYTFNYYEFSHPMADRLTDEAWKKAVYGTESIEQYKPFWNQNVSLPASAPQSE